MAAPVTSEMTLLTVTGEFRVSFLWVLGLINKNILKWTQGRQDGSAIKVI